MHIFLFPHQFAGTLLCVRVTAGRAARGVRKASKGIWETPGVLDNL